MLAPCSSMEFESEILPAGNPDSGKKQRALGDRSKMRPYVWIHLDDERRRRSRRVQLSGKPVNEGTAVGGRLGFGNLHAAGAARSSSGNLLA